MRPQDDRAAALLRTATVKSPTVAALVRALGTADVIVMVQLTLLPNGLAGDLRILGASATCRYVVIRVDASRPPDEQMALLGHELHHANEVAGAPDVRDEAGLVSLMVRIGRATGGGTYETNGAVVVTRHVRCEVARRPQAPEP